MGLRAAERAAHSAFYGLDSGRAKRPEKEEKRPVRRNKINSLFAKQEAQIMGGKSISPSHADEAEEFSLDV